MKSKKNLSLVLGVTLALSAGVARAATSQILIAEGDAAAPAADTATKHEGKENGCGDKGGCHGKGKHKHKKHERKKKHAAEQGAGAGAGAGAGDQH